MNTPVVLKNTLLEWLLSVCVACASVAAMMGAMQVRGRPLSFYSFNKGAALTAMLLVLVVIALGSLYRTTHSTKPVRYRRPLGIIAVVLMSIHTGLSLFVFPKYDWDYYFKNCEALLYGLISLIGFLLLWLTSYEALHRRMGRTAWKKLQNGVYVVLAVAFLHVCHLEKPSCWLGWLEGRVVQCADGGWMPPLSFVLFGCLVIVVVVRLLEPAMRRKPGGTEAADGESGGGDIS